MLFVAQSSFILGTDQFYQLHHYNYIYNNATKMGMSSKLTQQHTLGSEPDMYDTKLEYIKQQPSVVYEVNNGVYDVSLTALHNYDDNQNHHIDLSGHLDNNPINGAFSYMPKGGVDAKFYYKGELISRKPA